MDIFPLLLVVGLKNIEEANHRDDRRALFREGTESFTLDAYTAESAILIFRFSHASIRAILSHMNIPSVRLDNEWFPSVLCILLNRMAYPDRLETLGVRTQK